MKNNTFKIKKKSVKGEDGNKIISVRIKESTLEKLDDFAKQTNRSRNELINILLEHAVENIEVE
jgi:metal-responsive CopG/Arc/MetJ family transcriptional regulator